MSIAVKNILLVRPGVTESGLRGEFVGQGNVPMAPQGIRAVRRLARVLERWRYETVACGDLRRCVETAELLGEGHSPPTKIQPVPELRDVDYGRWTGKTLEQVRQQDTDRWQRWLNDPFTTAPPDGETLETVSQRVSQVKEALERVPEESVVVIAEDVPVQLLLCEFLGIDRRAYWRFLIDPASLTVVQIYHGEATLALLNFQPL